MSQSPNERRFDILFSGEPLNGTDVSEVRENLRELFKLGDEALERMFSGQPVSIKKNLDRKSAQQYQQALARAGARIQLVLHKTPGAGNAGAGDAPAQDTSRAADPGGLAVMPVGSLLGNGERETVPPRNVDTSHLSIEQDTAEENTSTGRAVFDIEDPFVAGGDTAAGDTAQGPRYPTPDHIELDSALTLAELGNLLARAEALPPLNVNTDHLSLADVGELLGPGQAESVPAPDISSDLSLAEAGSELLQAHERKVVESREVDTSALSLGD